MSTYRQRREAKADRLDDWAQKPIDLILVHAAQAGTPAATDPAERRVQRTPDQSTSLHCSLPVIRSSWRQYPQRLALRPCQRGVSTRLQLPRRQYASLVTSHS